MSLDSNSVTSSECTKSMKGTFIILAAALLCCAVQGKTLNQKDDRCPAENPPDHDVLLPAEDCQHFYKCNWGTPVLMPCPPNQEWSQELQRCDWPEVAKCSSGGNPPVKSTEAPLPNGCPPTNPPDHDVLLPAEDCQHFYKCNWGTPVLMPCPPNQEWSQELQRCDWPEIAQCSSGGNPPVNPTQPPVVPTQPPVKPTERPLPNGCPPTNPPDHDVLLPAEDCQHFYKCNNGKPVLIPCPPGLEWSQELQRCEWPEVAKCSSGGNPPVNPTQPPVVPTQPPVQPTEHPLPNGCPPTNPSDHDVLLPAEDCQHFYKCNNGKPVLIPCPPGLEWSQELQRCEWPEIAKCSSGGNPPVNPTQPPVVPTQPPVQPTEGPLPNGCPPTNPPDHDVLLPAEDCQHFYKCNNGKPVLIPCPPGLEWSQELQRCEWPEVAKCSSGGIPPVNPTQPPVVPTQPPVQPTEGPLPNGCPPTNPPDHDVLLPAEDCQHFYKCNNGKPVLIPCPPGLEWSQELQRCEWPEVAKCSSGGIPPVNPTQPPVVPTQPPVQPTEGPLPNGCPPTNPPDHDVLLPAEDCQHFYKCNNGKPVLIPCPPGLEWSQELQRCEWPEIAKCSSGGNPPVNPTQPPVVPTQPPVQPTEGPLPNGCPPTNPPDHDVLLPAEDCQHFYKCNNGKPVLIPCPPGLEWSQELQRCEWPEIAKCSSGGNPPVNPTQPPVVPTQPPVQPTEGPLPNGCPPTNPPDHDVLLPAEDCQHFYKCNNGKPVLIPCPPGLEWSQELQRCEWPEIAKCSSGGNPPVNPTQPPVVPTQPPVQPTEGPLPNGCPPTNPPDHDVLLPAEDCQHFYKCNNGKPVLIPCPPGLEWSQELQRCEWPEIAKCSSGGNPPVNPTQPPVVPTQPPVQPTEGPLPNGCPPTNPPDHDVLLPAEDCQHFYKCNNGKPVLIPCPPGLEWSQELQRCEWPEIAKCSSGGNPPVNPTQPPVVPTQPPVQPTEGPLPNGCPPTNPPDHDVLLPAEDCQHFYKCNHGKPVLIPCPPGLEWSQELQRCEWPEVAQCSRDGDQPSQPPVKPTPPPVKPTEQPVEPTQPQEPMVCPNTYEPNVDILYAAEDCGHYYQCDNGKPVLRSCPEGLEWCQARYRCEWPEIAQCSRREIPPPTFSTLPDGCPAENPEDHDVFLPATDCQHFYKCDNGIPVIQSCPDGLEWSQDLQRCEWPDLAQCSNDRNSPIYPSPTLETVPVPTYTPTKPTIKCPSDGQDIFLPAEDCQHYIECDQGVPKLRSCPGGLEWSQELERCDWPKIAKCSQKSDQLTPLFYTVLVKRNKRSDNEPNPQCPAENGRFEVIIGIPGVCDKFYKCDWGVAKVENCPPGTQFNHRMTRCDFPSEAQCVPGETGM